MLLEQQYKVFRGHSNLQVSENEDSSANLNANHATKYQLKTVISRKSNQIVPCGVFCKLLSRVLNVFRAVSWKTSIKVIPRAFRYRQRKATSATTI